MLIYLCSLQDPKSLKPLKVLVAVQICAINSNKLIHVHALVFLCFFKIYVLASENPLSEFFAAFKIQAPLKQFRPQVYKNLAQSNVFPNNRLGLPEDA